jgi:hypothetical protein
LQTARDQLNQFLLAWGGFHDASSKS